MEGSNNTDLEIHIPTFINMNLFWIVETRHFLLRAAMHRILSSQSKRPLCKGAEVEKENMVAVCIDGVWVRAVIDQSEEGYLCWLVDYGMLRLTDRVYKLPEDMKKCPNLAKQASLLNVVNMMTEISFGPTGCDVSYTKTTTHVEGTRKIALDLLEEAEEIHFRIRSRDNFNFYGDIICCLPNKKRESLTEYLIVRDLAGMDKAMFETIDPSRESIRENYFSQSSMWRRELVAPEREVDKKLAKFLSWAEPNPNFFPNEYFTRRH